MTSAPPAPPGDPVPGVPAVAGPPGAPAPGADRRRLAVAGGAVLLVALVGALVLRLTPVGERVTAAPCTVLTGERDVRPPAEVRDGAARARAAVATRGVAVTTTCSVPSRQDGVALDRADPAADPAQWVVGVDVAVDDVADLVAASDAVLAAARPDAPFAWRLDVRDAARSVAVVLESGGDAQPAARAVALRGEPGVTEVWLAPGDGLLTVATAQDVAPLLVATQGQDLPRVTVSAQTPWLEVQQVHPGAWPDPAAVELAADVAGWEGVWRVVLRGGAPASPTLTVEADDDVHRAHVASRLAALVHTGPAVTYDVSVDQVSVSGVVGRSAGQPGDAPGAPAGDAPGAPAGDGTFADAPRCTGDELRVEVLGTDAALGTRYLLLRATHTGTTVCVVEGVPGLAFTRQSGTRTPDLTQLPDLPDPAAPPAVRVEPGGALEAQVRWAAMSTSQDPDVAVGVTVRAVAGGPAVDLALPVPLDVLEGATVKVGPWAVPAS